jgi:hypothetical protein
VAAHSVEWRRDAAVKTSAAAAAYAAAYAAAAAGHGSRAPTARVQDGADFAPVGAQVVEVAGANNVVIDNFLNLIVITCGAGRGRLAVVEVVWGVLVQVSVVGAEPLRLLLRVTITKMKITQFQIKNTLRNSSWSAACGPQSIALTACSCLDTIISDACSDNKNIGYLKRTDFFFWMHLAS